MRAAVLACLLLAAAALPAADDGGQPAAFLKNGVGARAMGMGGAFIAIADDAYGMTYNPAGLELLSGNQVGLASSFFPDDLMQHYIGVASKASQGGSDYGYGLSWTQMRVGRSLERYNTSTAAQPDGTFSASDNAYRVAAAAWALPGKLSLGADLKYLQSSVDDITSSGYGLDLGMLYLPGNGLSLGVVLNDPFTVINWSSGLTERPSMSLRLGGAWKSEGPRPLTLALEAGQAGPQSIASGLGLEWEVLPGRGWLRSGLADGAWTFGFGLRVMAGTWGGQLDYALSTDPSHGYSFGMTDLVNRLGLTVLLGS